MKKNHKLRKTISVKQFISEFGQDFSNHVKDRLCELGTRCILTRTVNNHTLDLKHIEHTKYGLDEHQKEYAYGQLIINDGMLYFSNNCLENDEIEQVAAVNNIYNSLQGVATLCDDTDAKIINDDNIDFVVDSILEVCPKVSAEHAAILSKYIH